MELLKRLPNKIQKEFIKGHLVDFQKELQKKSQAHFNILLIKAKTGIL